MPQARPKLTLVTPIPLREKPKQKPKLSHRRYQTLVRDRTEEILQYVEEHFGVDELPEELYFDVARVVGENYCADKGIDAPAPNT